MRIRDNWRKIVLGIGINTGIAMLAFCWGRTGEGPQAAAQSPAAAQSTTTQPPSAAYHESSPSDYSRRVLAYVGNTEVTREDLGEYLIARYGSERIEILINKRIIELACKERGIEVTRAEIDAAFIEDCRSMKVSKEEFVNQILKQHYKKSLYEWKEDVIRHRLQMNKLCRDKVRVTEEELRKAYDARYGEKVKCQMIMWKNEEKNRVLTSIYAKIRDSKEEFDHAAKYQYLPQLAAKVGHVDPIGRNTTGNDELEKELFSLNTNEISKLIETPQGCIVVKCLGRVSATTEVSFEKVRPELERDMIEKKVQADTPALFKELREKYKVQSYVRTFNEDDILREAKETAKRVADQSGKVPAGPQGK
jgi:hypothetical protein